MLNISSMLAGLAEEDCSARLVVEYSAITETFRARIADECDATLLDVNGEKNLLAEASTVAEAIAALDSLCSTEGY